MAATEERMQGSIETEEGRRGQGAKERRRGGKGDVKSYDDKHSSSTTSISRSSPIISLSISVARACTPMSTMTVRTTSSRRPNSTPPHEFRISSHEQSTHCRPQPPDRRAKSGASEFICACRKECQDVSGCVRMCQRWYRARPGKEDTGARTDRKTKTQQ